MGEQKLTALLKEMSAAMLAGMTRDELREVVEAQSVEIQRLGYEATHGREVVTYCGSKRFRLLMQQHAMEAMASDQNLLILLPDWWDVKTEPGYVDMPGVAWRRKMLISDRVFVFNFGDYIGDDTREDIGAAVLSGKTIDYLEPR